MTEMTELDRSTQTLTLRDGRRLGYAEWGNLNGKPVFYFSSPEASRYSRHPNETILTDLGVHLYTFDRPGRGLSTPHNNRHLLDWADDIRDFVQQKILGVLHSSDTHTVAPPVWHVRMPFLN